MGFDSINQWRKAFVKYYLNFINTSSQHQYKSYSMVIFSGIGFDF